MENEHVTIRDANGCYRVFKREDLLASIVTDQLTIYGLNTKEIAALRHLYMSLGGIMPITTASIDSLLLELSPHKTTINEITKESPYVF